jgi:hypothetical protein
MFQGLRIVCQVLIPGVVGPAIGAKVLENAKTIVNNDGTESFLPDERIFLASLVVSMILIIYLLITTAKKEGKNG